MSQTIDKRVVEMQFDNSHFERNVSTTMSTLDRLKQSLNLSGAVKGFGEVDKASRGLSFSGLSSAVDTVRAKFSSLEVMGVTALANITNSAVNAGKRIVSALTIEPIKMGFQEYETQIGAVQTILANTQHSGTNIDQVNAALDELNAYADKTIYNFTEMTRNIGTFTAAGVDLDKSVQSIKGIANLAAVSGSTSQQASTAMYQLSQALAAGKVSLMDWNSVVNAGMGGKVFQDALIRTSELLGTGAQKAIDTYGSFRESLTQGEWLTAEVLTETLAQLSGAYSEADLIAQGFTKEQAKEIMSLAETAENAATKVKTFTQLWDTLKESAQSGWSQTWEIVVGDFEEAKETLTKFSDVLGEMIGNTANARNELLQGWKDAGGRIDLLDSLWNAFEGIMNIVNPIKEAFREIFPATTVEQLVNFTSKLKELTATFAEFTGSHAEQIKSTFKGIFAVLDIGWTLIKELAGGIVDLIRNFTGFGGSMLDATASLGDWLSGLRDSIKESDIFGRSVDKIVGFLTVCIDKVKEFAGAIKEYFQTKDFNGFVDFFGGIWESMKNFGAKVKELLSPVTEAFSNVFTGDTNLFNVLNSGLFAGILVGIQKFVSGLTDLIGDDGVGGLLENLTGILDDVRGCFEAYQNSLKADTLLKIAGAIGILAAALLVIANIDRDGLDQALGGLTVLFVELLGSLSIFSKISTDVTGVSKSIAIMFGISTSILILASAMKKIGDLDWGQIAKGLVGVGGLMAELAAFMAVAKFDGNTTGTAIGIVILSSAMLIMASAVEDFGSMNWEEIGKGLAAIGGLLAELAIFTNLTGNASHVIATGTAMVILGASMKIFASAMADFSGMSWEDIGKGFASIAGILTGLAVFTNVVGNAQHVTTTAVAMVILGASMKIFASAVKDFSDMSWEEIGRGLVAMGGALAEVAIAMRLMPTNGFTAGAGLMIASTALIVLSDAMSSFGGMSWEEIGRGLVAMGGALAELAIALNLMNGTVAGSAALIVAAGAIAIMAPSMKLLGDMSWESIGKGLVTIAGAFTVIGVAGLLLSPVVGTIAALAGSFLLFGASILGIGAGVTLLGVGLNVLATGIATLSTVTAAGATAIVAALSIILTGIADLIPTLVSKLGDAILEFCNVIVECAPAIAETLLAVLTEVMGLLAEYTPQMVDYLMDFFIGVLDALADKMPDLIRSAADVIGAFFQGIVDELKGVDSTNLIEGIVAIGFMAALMAALSALTGLIPGAMLGVAGMGVVIAELAIVLAAIGGLAQIPGLNWLISEGGDLLQNIGTAIGQFVGGIAGGIAEGATSTLPQIGTNLSEFMTNAEGFINGAKNLDSSMLEGVRALAETVLILTAADLLDGLNSWFSGAWITGGSSIADFGEDLSELGTHLAAFANNLGTFGEDKVTTITCAANAIKAIAEASKEIPNEGGWLAAIVGDNNIADFGANLAGLGTSLAEFANGLGTFGEDKVTTITCAANAIKAIADAAKDLPNEGGWISKIVGENNIADFGSNFASLGESLAAFANNLGTFNDDKVATVTCAANAIKAIADSAKDLPNEGGWAAKIFGDNSIGTFGANFAELGTNLAAFAENLGTFGNDKVASIDSAVNAIKALTGLVGADIASAAVYLDEFSIRLVPFSETLASFCNNMASITNASLAASNLKAVLSIIKDIAAANVDPLSTFSESLKTVGADAVQQFVSAFTDTSVMATLEDGGAQLAIRVVMGLRSEEKSLFNAGEALSSNAVTGVRSKYQAFYDAGGYLVGGFAKGISANSYRAEAQARAMAAKAAQAAEDELEIQSPSKVFYRIGDYAGMGFVNALKDYSDKAYTVSSDVANSAKRGLGDTVRRIKNIIGSDVDVQPTIRPVLDLSDVRSGVGSISGMFNMRPSVGVMANVGAISATMTRNGQNGVNDDVVFAINKLRGDLGKLGTTQYNINGITYDDGSNIADAVKKITRQVKIERRV